MCLVLVSFSPCVLKEAFFNGVKVEYAGTINKFKTTTSSCQSTLQNKIQNQISCELNLPDLNLLNNSGDLYIKNNSVGSVLKYSKSFSGNSPPKYILFKRLKIAIA